MTKTVNKLPKYWIYHERYMMVQVRSLGHKWVWFRVGPESGPHQQKFQKLRRSDWDRSVICTAEILKYESEILRAAKLNGISNIVSCKKVQSHPTKKFGWCYKTFEEIEQEVLDLGLYRRSA